MVRKGYRRATTDLDQWAQQDGLEEVLAMWRADSMSKQTSNHYLRAMKQFWNWLVKTKRALKNPVADIPILNVATDRRHDRRPLTAEELSRVVASAECSNKTVESIRGKDRAMMYVLAAWTGFRRGEIGSLKLSSFELEANPATVTVEALYSKRKRRDTSVLHETVIERLKKWISEKQPNAKQILFPVSGKVEGGIDRKTAKMMRKDLEAAREIWLNESVDEAERKTREASDFLLYKDHAGKFADFHANRHTYITNLAKAGVSPKTAQTLARHSDPRLTMNIYTHSNLDEQVEAVSRLPGIRECIGSKRKSQDGLNGHSVSEDGETEETSFGAADLAETKEKSGKDANCQPMSRKEESTPQRCPTRLCIVYQMAKFRRSLAYWSAHQEPSTTNSWLFSSRGEDSKQNKSRRS